MKLDCQVGGDITYYPNSHPFFCEVNIFIYMKFIISENKVESLKQIAQYLIDNELNNLRIMSDEEWGLGEMEEIEEVSSVDKIIVDKIEMSDGVNVYIDMYVLTDREEFDLVLGAVEYSLEQWLPNLKVHVNEIILSE
jgi:hypothetical protein